MSESGSDQDEEFSPEGCYQYVDKLSDLSGDVGEKAVVFALLDFDRPVTIVPGCKGG